MVNGHNCKQFWKAGDYEGDSVAAWDVPSGNFFFLFLLVLCLGGMDHVRVHPKFLHSNATSHKWALGAFAELMDNALDEVCNGATLVKVDMMKSGKDGSRMLLIEDDGGGMDPDKMRRCMSLGYSAKSKVDNAIGQCNLLYIAKAFQLFGYGNGFKTSTMRLGADVIVFSRCCGQNGKRPTQSIGLLSYTFLRNTGKEDIVVPMLDYEREGQGWSRIARLSDVDWTRNVETILQWSPFLSETDLLRELDMLSDHGTRIIIYNLWEDDEGFLELDFDADPHDIQLRGVNREEKNIQMAKEFPNSRHFLTYKHSLRSYASILYLRIPPAFRIILRGKDVEHHNIVNDMMMSQDVIYRPQAPVDGTSKDHSSMTAAVTVGFVKDAKYHIDVQGFNVYHKNRLIKPFWRLWNAAGSDGRGVIGVLEANFVEPAHDKQGFERTTVLSRLETRLIQMQKNYWCSNCHKIGYAPRRNKKGLGEERETIFSHDQSSGGKAPTERPGKVRYGKQNVSRKGNNSITKSPVKYRKGFESSEPSSPSEDANESNFRSSSPLKKATSSAPASKTLPTDVLDGNRPSAHLGHSRIHNDSSPSGECVPPVIRTQSKVIYSSVMMSFHWQADVVNLGEDGHVSAVNTDTSDRLKQENRVLKERLEKREAELRLMSLKCQKCSALKIQLDQAQQKVEDLNKEQESLIDIFSEEKERRDKEEDNLRKKLKDASNTIQELLDKARLLEKMQPSSSKAGR
ncbi:unnamed protein product [Linum tenue]|uniref:Morc S5 domain-containing protein n=1 Tax=Linum tenue TaxID=586396 RepID=A0AAV0QRL2_9ROSI|nr:unnamed protein product [Linum tenue]